MKTRAAMWGNSIGVRIPTSMAAKAGIAPGTQLRVLREGHSLRIEPIAPQRPSLRDLLRGITRDNRHGEATSGSPVGAETID